MTLKSKFNTTTIDPIRLFHACIVGFTLQFNPLSPDIKMHILLTVFHTLHMELVRRICLNIKTSSPW